MHFSGIGGTNVYMERLRQGSDIGVAIPGLLLNLWRNRRMNLVSCRSLARMRRPSDSLGNRERHPRHLQILYGAATDADVLREDSGQIMEFSSSALVKPVVVIVGRAGGTSLNIA